AFRLKDGQRIVLAQDWQVGGQKAEFLREVRKAACASFSTVLGPDYNAAHHNHFHLDMGVWQVCR
ncbi:MAG: extensin, partial [Pseudomonas sp.]